jgi:hypothetical protein
MTGQLQPLTNDVWAGWKPLGYTDEGHDLPVRQTRTRPARPTPDRLPTHTAAGHEIGWWTPETGWVVPNDADMESSSSGDETGDVPDVRPASVLRA